MRRYLIPLAVLAILGTMVPVASAASALSLLDPYVVNYLEDDDYEIGLPQGATDYSNPLGPADTLDVGDILVGMVVIQPNVQSLEGPNVGNPRAVVDYDATFTGIFAVSVATKVADGNAWDYTFGNLSTAQWTSLTGYTPLDTYTMAVFFSDQDETQTPAWIDAGAGTDILDAFDTAMDSGPMLWEFGFDVTDPGDLFWKADSQYDTIGGIAGNQSTLLFNVAMDVTEYGAGPKLLPFSLTDVSTEQAFAGVYSDVQITGRNSPGISPNPYYFPVFTDSEIYLKPTPEPTTMALLGLGLLGVGGVVYRRRRNK